MLYRRRGREYPHQAFGDPAGRPAGRSPASEPVRFADPLAYPTHPVYPVRLAYHFLILAVIGAVHARDAVAVIQHLTLREQHTGRRVGLLLGCVANLQLRHAQRRGQTKKQGNSGLYDASQPFFHVSRSSCKRHRKGAVFHLPLLAGITFLSSVWHAAWR